MCELCNLNKKKKTKWYYADNNFVVCDCLTCHKPMVVLRKHTMEISEAMETVIGIVVYRLFGDFTFRKEQRKIKDHLHWHIEKHE